MYSVRFCAPKMAVWGGKVHAVHAVLVSLRTPSPVPKGEGPGALQALHAPGCERQADLVFGWHLGQAQLLDGERDCSSCGNAGPGWTCAGYRNGVGSRRGARVTLASATAPTATIAASASTCKHPAG